MTVYCVGCGFDTESALFVCESCSVMNSVPTCFVPATCGDDDCYLLPNGEINLDGVDCSHADDVHQLFSMSY